MTPEHAELVAQLNEAIAEGAGSLADATLAAITALSEENERLREVLRRTEAWFQGRMDGLPLGGTTRDRLEDIRAALGEKQ